MNALMKFLGEDDSDNRFVVCHNESEVKENMSCFGKRVCHYYRERYGTVKSRNGAILCGKR